MDTIQLDSLLRRSESETLDFKRKIVSFSKADEDQKAELLKDILAMANAWKNSDAHIVIGVEEESGRVKTICGAETSLNDSDIQQFVNSKTTCPVSFRIVVTKHEGKDITVIQVDRIQNRPICLKKDFGGLKENVVYIRRGSSTSVALASEIADMGRDEKQQRPERTDHFWKRFKVYFIDIENKVFYIKNSSSHIIYESTIVEHSLPVDEFKNLLREAGELDLEIEFYQEFKTLADKVSVLDGYMKLGADKINNKWRPNFNCELESAFIQILNMKRKYIKS